MAILIEAIGADRLADYARVPMVCDVRSVLAVDEINGGIGGLGLQERTLRVPFTKDYDAYADGGPLNWHKRFDLSTWGLWIGGEGGDVVCGAAVARNTPGIQMLEGRGDLAVLWDIRVRASSRLQGAGTALFREAVRWAKSNGCRLLQIETQNVNVDACKFYAKMGCCLGRIDRLAYSRCPEVASEVMLVWYLDLSS
jgi:GNAT superfamily N-acetyltransferase